MKIVMMSSGTINSTLTYRIMSLAKSLVKRGNDVTIITPSLDKYSHFKKEHLENLEGVKVIRPFQFNTTSRLLNLIPYIFHTIKILHSIQFDVIHLYKPSPITITGLLPKFTKKTPIIVDMDDLGSKVMDQENNFYITVKIVQFCELLSLKYANGIICASSYLQKNYNKRYHQKPITWISNGVEEKFFKTVLKKSNVENRIITIGSLNRTNILEPLIQALPEVAKKLYPKKPEVLMIGDGQALPHLKKMAEQLHVDQYITFTGLLPMEKIPQYTRLADVGYTYMPDDETIRACSNLKIFQYMAMGVVPLVSTVGDLPYYIHNGEAGYIAKSKNVSALTLALTDALTNDKKRLEKALLAQEFVKEHFTWDILAHKAETFYKSII